jgi:arylsulfatase A
MRFSLFALLLATGFVTAAPPNVVLVLADDLGQRDLGCYGSTYHKTPHLDAFAKANVKLVDAYSACPVCSPSRAALMTGKHPARLHLTDWLGGRPDQPSQKLNRPNFNKQLALEETTLAEVFKANGYATAIFGKWHLGNKGFAPTDQGFDVFKGGFIDSSFAPYTKNKNGIAGLGDAPEGEYITDRLTDETIKFITANKDKPFFAYLPFFTPHIPLQAKAEVIAKYKDGGAPGTQNNPTYAAMLESMDDNFARLLKTLDELKLADNTIVIFTSDNGGLSIKEGPNTPATSNAPYREAKGFLYEGGVRIPFLIRGPGIVKGDVPIIGTDVMPTLLGFCKLKCDVKFDGQDKSRFFSNNEIDWQPPTFYWHYPHYSNQGGHPGAAIRDGNWKYIEFYDTGRQELYDLAKDISESKNLVAEKPDVVKTLAKKLADWRTETKAQMMTPNPDYTPSPQAKDGTITMVAKWAEITGAQLRYEPLPHKNTLGFWTNKDDSATWEFTVTTPGTFDMTITQGCGKGNGGAEVEFTLSTQTLKHTVKDTGGWQKFEDVKIGQVKIESAGRYTLKVAAKSKPGGAVMDLRQVVLTPVKP